MPVIAVDLGGTKLATTVFSEDGVQLEEESISLAKRGGTAVGALITEQVQKFSTIHKEKGDEISAIGICVPGISHKAKGTVWAPNIQGWEDYPLRDEIQGVVGRVPVVIDSDRACYIMGEAWKGAAQQCTDAIFLAVGTGIGAGILINGALLRGAHDIAGAMGWMALRRPFDSSYAQCGYFESQASGEGIAKQVRTLLASTGSYNGFFSNLPPDEIKAKDVFLAYEQNDTIAQEVMCQCIELWGMSIANLVSLFDPQKIILGGGVFGPAVRFIPQIHAEALKWAQPVSMQQVNIGASVLGGRAGLYGAGLLAIQETKEKVPYA